MTKEDLPVGLVGKDQLIGLDRDGRDCEVCGFHMHAHEWAVMDDHGFVVFCNFAQLLHWEISTLVQRMTSTSKYNKMSPQEFTKRYSERD